MNTEEFLRPKFSQFTASEKLLPLIEILASIELSDEEKKKVIEMIEFCEPGLTQQIQSMYGCGYRHMAGSYAKSCESITGKKIELR